MFVCCLLVWRRRKPTKNKRIRWHQGEDSNRPGRYRRGVSSRAHGVRRWNDHRRHFGRRKNRARADRERQRQHHRPPNSHSGRRFVRRPGQHEKPRETETGGEIAHEDLKRTESSRFRCSFGAVHSETVCTKMNQGAPSGAFSSAGPRRGDRCGR